MEDRRQRLVLQALAVLVVCHNAVLGVEASPAPLGKGNITRGSQVFGKTCTDLGFSGLQLCSDCKLMARYVSNKGTENHSTHTHTYIHTHTHREREAGDAKQFATSDTL